MRNYELVIRELLRLWVTLLDCLIIDSYANSIVTCIAGLPTRISQDNKYSCSILFLYFTEPKFYQLKFDLLCWSNKIRFLVILKKSGFKNIRARYNDCDGKYFQLAVRLVGSIPSLWPESPGLFPAASIFCQFFLTKFFVLQLCIKLVVIKPIYIFQQFFIRNHCFFDLYHIYSKKSFFIKNFHFFI